MSDAPKLAPVEAFTKRLIVFCGSGGVGKTTISAAVALSLALQGKKVLVMTIDPARRLMDSLGMKEQGETSVRAADLSAFENRAEGGSLHAVMLETRRHMDEVVQRLSPDTDTYERILENRIYQVLADNFSGSQETIALVKLHDFTEEDYDHIIVDTAPHRYAIEFFETPSRITDFLDPKVFRWFSMPLDAIKERGYSFFKSGTDFVLNQVEKAIGLNFVSEVTTLLGLFEGLSDRFRERSQGMRDLLKDGSQASFNVVAAPTTFSASDASYLLGKIEELSFPNGAIIFNRVHEVPRLDVVEGNASNELPLNDGGDAALRDLATRLIEGHRTSVRISDREQAILQQFRGRYPEGLVRIPFFSTDVTELRGLAMLTTFLFPEEQAEKAPV